jgi:hypothetical protein
MIAKMKRDRFGASSERSRKLLDQLEMQLEELETAGAENEAAAARGHCHGNCPWRAEAT